MRSLSAEIRAELTARETGEAILVLLTLDHDELETPIRLVTDLVDCISRGNTFVGGFPFDLVLPDDSETQPQSQLRMHNLDPAFFLGIDLISSPPTVLIELIRGSEPDQVEVSWPFLQLLNVKGDEVQITGVLGFQDYSVEPWPRLRAIRRRCPGTWKIRT